GEALHEFIAAGGTKVTSQDAPPAKAGKGITSADVVKATATLGSPDKDGKRKLSVKLQIEKPWHTYPNPVPNDHLEGARTTVQAYSAGKKLPAAIEYPGGTAEKDDKGAEYRVYMGEVAITGTLTAADPTDLEVRVKVQACTSGDNGRCLQGATLKIPV